GSSTRIVVSTICRSDCTTYCRYDSRKGAEYCAGIGVLSRCQAAGTERRPQPLSSAFEVDMDEDSGWMLRARTADPYPDPGTEGSECLLRHRGRTRERAALAPLDPVDAVRGNLGRHRQVGVLTFHLGEEHGFAGPASLVGICCVVVLDPDPACEDGRVGGQHE